MKPKESYEGKKGVFYVISDRSLQLGFYPTPSSLVLLAIVVIGLYLDLRGNFTKLIGFLVVSLVAVGLVFNADGVKDILLELFNKIIGCIGNPCYTSAMEQALIASWWKSTRGLGSVTPQNLNRERT